MTLPAEIEDLIASLKAQILALQAENSELRRRLGLDSSNSSKPPSSDGLKKKPRILGSLRGRSDKQSGGQKGHQGGTLRQVANPDAAVRHEACACGHCGAALDATSATGIEKRQVFDIPERPLLVTEHQATIYHCMRCRGVTKATFPEGVVSPTQYGERIKAAAIYLNVQQLIPEDRAAQALSDLFGAPLICPASIVAWVGKKARELCQVYEAIGQRVAEAGVRHLDETGYRIAGKLHWLHTTSSLSFTFYRAGEKRGELQALIEFEKEPWAELMRTMLLDANAAVDKAREAGACALPPETVAAFTERYWAAVRLGLGYHRQLPKLEPKSPSRGRSKQRPGHNLLERLKTFKTETLRFMTDFDVPFTNNLAEQDLRMMKVRMKISGCFRTLEGARIFVTLRSVVSTARKQGCNILHVLTAASDQVMRAIAA